MYTTSVRSVPLTSTVQSHTVLTIICTCSTAALYSRTRFVTIQAPPYVYLTTSHSFTAWFPLTNRGLSPFLLRFYYINLVAKFFTTTPLIKEICDSTNGVGWRREVYGDRFSVSDMMFIYRSIIISRRGNPPLTRFYWIKFCYGRSHIKAIKYSRTPCCKEECQDVMTVV